MPKGKTGKRYTTDQILAVLQRVQKGERVVDVCREIGTTEQTYCRWKSRYGGMTQSELHRSRQLESENARLKRLLAERDLELDLARELLSKKS